MVMMMDKNRHENTQDDELRTGIGDNLSERILRKYMDPVIKQALIELAMVKSVFVSSMSHVDEDKLRDIGYRVKLVKGSMIMLSLGRAANILHSCNQYIAGVLPTAAGESINRECTRLFLDIIDDMSRYLNGLCGEIDSQETLLSTMEDKVLRLSGPISGRTSIDPGSANLSIRPERSSRCDDTPLSMEEEAESGMDTAVAEGREKLNIELKKDFLQTAGKNIKAGGMVLLMLRKSPDSVVLVKEFRKILSSLKASALAAGLSEVVELCHSMELLVAMLMRRDDRHAEEINDLLIQSYEQLTEMVEQYGHQETTIPVEELVLRINRRLMKPSGGLLNTGPMVAEDHSDRRSRDGSDRRGEVRKSHARSADMRGLQSPPDSSEDMSGQLDRQLAKLSDLQLGIDETYVMLRSRLDEMRAETGRLRKHLNHDKRASLVHGEDVHDGEGDVRMRGYLDETDRLHDRNSRLMNSLERYLIRQQQVIASLMAGLRQTRTATTASQIIKLENIVKQISNELAKDVKLNVIGEQIRLKRVVLTSLFEPLKYLVAYSIEHGIEDSVSRIKSGKPATGSVSLEFIKDKSGLEINIRDDGAAIDLGKVREAAIRLGYVNSRNELSDTEVRALVFNPGFNEKSDLPELKARGVPLSDVARMIRSLGGSVIFGTTRQAGNTFVVRVPCELDVNQVLIAQVNQEIYAIPMANVEEVVYLKTREIDALQSGDDCQYEHHGHNYRFRNLGMVLGIEQSARPEQDIQHPVILIFMGNRRIALQVDQIKGQREIIVNQPVPELNRIKVISGATLLSDGRLVLVLELGALLGEDVGNLKAIK